MRRSDVLDLILLEADGGLDPKGAARLKAAAAGDPGLQRECESVQATWREIRALGRAVAMRPDFGDEEIAAQTAPLHHPTRSRPSNGSGPSVRARALEVDEAV